MRATSKRGNPNMLSEFCIGSYYYNGIGGVQKDLFEAYKWFLKSAKNGFAKAQYYVGRLLYYGILANDGTFTLKVDLTCSKMWFKRGADQGDSSCQMVLNGNYF